MGRFPKGLIHCTGQGNIPTIPDGENVTSLGHQCGIPYSEYFSELFYVLLSELLGLFTQRGRSRTVSNVLSLSPIHITLRWTVCL